MRTRPPQTQAFFEVVGRRHYFVPSFVLHAAPVVFVAAVTAVIAVVVIFVVVVAVVAVVVGVFVAVCRMTFLQRVILPGYSVHIVIIHVFIRFIVFIVVVVVVILHKVVCWWRRWNKENRRNHVT